MARNKKSVVNYAWESLTDQVGGGGIDNSVQLTEIINIIKGLRSDTDIEILSQILAKIRENITAINNIGDITITPVVTSPKNPLMGINDRGIHKLMAIDYNGTKGIAELHC